ncbi:chromo domain shadow [Neofusicoccum parvum]|nr:chromo domain shadow [Neofusicoccum parvum]
MMAPDRAKSTKRKRSSTIDSKNTTPRPTPRKRQKKTGNRQHEQPAGLDQSAQPASVESDSFYEARAILKETKNKYLIDWENDRVTGEVYQPTWEPKRNANKLLVDDWKCRKLGEQGPKKQPQQQEPTSAPSPAASAARPQTDTSGSPAPTTPSAATPKRKPHAPKRRRIVQSSSPSPEPEPEADSVPVNSPALDESRVIPETEPRETRQPAVIVTQPTDFNPSDYERFSASQIPWGSSQAAPASSPQLQQTDFTTETGTKDQEHNTGEQEDEGQDHAQEIHALPEIAETSEQEPVDGEQTGDQENAPDLNEEPGESAEAQNFLTCPEKPSDSGTEPSGSGERAKTPQDLAEVSAQDVTENSPNSQRSAQDFVVSEQNHHASAPVLNQQEDSEQTDLQHNSDHWQAAQYVPELDLDRLQTESSGSRPSDHADTSRNSPSKKRKDSSQDSAESGVLSQTDPNVVRHPFAQADSYVPTLKDIVPSIEEIRYPASDTEMPDDSSPSVLLDEPIIGEAEYLIGLSMEGLQGDQYRREIAFKADAITKFTEDDSPDEQVVHEIHDLLKKVDNVITHMDLGFANADALTHFGSLGVFLTVYAT